MLVLPCPAPTALCLQAAKMSIVTKVWDSIRGFYTRQVVAELNAYGKGALGDRAGCTRRSAYDDG